MPPTKINWNDCDARDDADEMVAIAIGWKKHPKDPLWLEGEKDRFTGFFTNFSRPSWNPTNDADLALRAAGIMADRRRATFRLDRQRDGAWRAEFTGGGRFSEIQATQSEPCWAICDAIIRLSEAPDLSTLFAGHQNRR